MQKTKIPSQKSKRRKINEVYQAEMEAKLKVTQAEEQPAQKGRKYTVSLALPGTIIENAQSAELRTYLAGQVLHSGLKCRLAELWQFLTLTKL